MMIATSNMANPNTVTIPALTPTIRPVEVYISRL